jgi:hypothetical protein
VYSACVVIRHETDDTFAGMNPRLSVATFR